MSTRLSVNVKHHPSPCKSRGFTMMEIIAVIVILGIITAVAIPRFTKSRTDDLAAANTLKAHLRYAQLRAMGDIVPWGIEIEADRYTLVRWDDKNDNFDDAPVNLPGENSKTKVLDKSTISNTGTVSFSPARGIPDPNGHSIDIGTRTITITAETGFIE
jgi:prepilin-type N-terminal cleavage/methylation domain-containing protein